MAFAGRPGHEIPANQPETSRPQVPGVGPDTAQYGRVWPNDWPNGQLHHDIERRCIAPVTIDRETGAPAGCASRSRRARRTCSTAAEDSGLMRVLDASPARRMVAGSPRHPIRWTTSRRRRGACVPVLATARVDGPGRALALSSNRAASETSSVAPATACVVEEQSRAGRSRIGHAGRPTSWVALALSSEGGLGVTRSLRRGRRIACDDRVRAHRAAIPPQQAAEELAPAAGAGGWTRTRSRGSSRPPGSGSRGSSGRQD